MIGRRKENLLETTKRFLNKNYFIYLSDNSSNTEVTKMFQKIKHEVGQIIILVNKAGIGFFDVAEQISEPKIHKMIDINLKGAIFCTQAVLSNMKERNYGTIANIIFTAGLEEKMTESVYSASKFGVRGLLKAYRLN